MRIYKYEVSPDVDTVAMPEGARILTVQAQRNSPHLWAMVNTLMPLVQRRIYTAGTGEQLPLNIGDAAYIGTFQLSGGALVFHVFDFGEVTGE